MAETLLAPIRKQTPEAAPASGIAAPAPHSWLRRHAGIVLLTLAGAGLRGLVVYAYAPAFWFSDTTSYLWFSKYWAPGPLRPNGYSVFLAALGFTGDLGWVAVVQHVIGLSLVVLGYAFLRRRGVARWLAVLGTAPLALDPRLVVMEHYIMAESLFIAALILGLVLLFWRERPGPALAAGAAAALLIATLTRNLGLPVAIVGLVFLLIRRAGWRPVVVYSTVLLLPLVAYASWFNAYYGHYALSGWQGRFLYGRTAQIADCGRLPLTDELRSLCPPQPLGHRPERADWYVWADESPAHRYGTNDDAPLLQEFALTVITHQKRDYAKLVARDTATFFLPWRHPGPSATCMNAFWRLGYRGQLDQPAYDPQFRRNLTDTTCQPLLTVGDSYEYAEGPRHSKPRAALAWYSEFVKVPGLVLLLGLLIAAIGAVWRPRRAGTHDRLVALMLAGCGFALAVCSFATAMLDFRYGIPAVPLMVLGGVLGFAKLRSPAPSPSPGAAALPRPRPATG